MDTSTVAPARSVSPVGATDIAAGLIWLGTYVVARLLIPTMEPHSNAAVALAVLPVVPGLIVLWRISKAVARLDELQRRVHLEALGIAFGLAVMLLWTLGLLELAIPLDSNNWSYRHVWGMMPALYFCGLAISWRRYK